MRFLAGKTLRGEVTADVVFRREEELLPLGACNAGEVPAPASFTLQKCKEKGLRNARGRKPETAGGVPPQTTEAAGALLSTALANL